MTAARETRDDGTKTSTSTSTSSNREGDGPRTRTATATTAATSRVSSTTSPDVPDIALLGNGRDEELSESQMGAIHKLHGRVADLRRLLVEAWPHDAAFCDLETCRRYLVARSWDVDRAEEQLASTLLWRREHDPAGMDFWQSPKALANPHALSMRVVGCDVAGRPIAYTAFAEAMDRWDVDANVKHMTLLVEASMKLLMRRRARGLNRTATSRQWVWVIDFDGFGLRDQNPRSAVVCSRLMLHYPEMLHLAVLVDAPALFGGAYRLVSPVLDDRVKSKIIFVKGRENAEDLLRTRLGTEAAEWLASETKDNKEKRPGQKAGSPKKYWAVPQTKYEHDPRGMPSYVGSDDYIKTPGDAFLEISSKN